MPKSKFRSPQEAVHGALALQIRSVPLYANEPVILLDMNGDKPTLLATLVHRPKRASLWWIPAFGLLGCLPLTALAQSHDISGVRTSLTDRDPVDVGTVSTRGSDSVTVKSDLFTRVFRINSRTEIRRVDSSQLQVGDEVSIRCHFDDKGIAIADSIEANVDRWEGVITKVLKDAVYIRFDLPVKGNAKVIFDGRTEFGYCAGDDIKRDCTVNDLKVGRHLETVGFVLGKGELRATRVLSIQKH